MGADAQMARAYAKRNVASVQYAHPFGDRAFVKRVACPMGHPTNAVVLELTIAAIGLRSVPEPTSFFVIDDKNVFEKSLMKRKRGSRSQLTNPFLLARSSLAFAFG
jgi:hypothetical protein